MALSPGDTLLSGQYRIVRPIGKGGFGFVYHSVDTRLDEEVAIKELIPGLVGDEKAVKRFLVEAKATLRLTHERIVRTYHVFGEGANYYIVMEYMAGGSLEARLQEAGRSSTVPPGEAAQAIAQVCDGLEYAHAHGVVHCDLKPANILFTAGGGAKVADFGIAHISEELLSRSWQTPAGFIAGTLPYMSPEQTEGVRDDPRVDVYALGAVLYRMLTGRAYLDFDARDTPGAQARNVQRICDQPPAPPSQHNPAVPAWLDGVVLRALAKEPAGRYQGVGELRAALRSGGAEAIPPPALEPVARPAEASAQPSAGPEVRVPAPGRPTQAKRERRLVWSLAGVAAGPHTHPPPAVTIARICSRWCM